MKQYDWQQDIEPLLKNLQPIDGGFTNANVGTLQLNDGTIVFIKEAIDENTKKWTKKEAAVYGILNQELYEFAPRMISKKADSSSIVLEYLADYEFDRKWDEAMLVEVIVAREELKKLKSHFENHEDYYLHNVTNFCSRWPEISDEKIERINRVFKECSIDVQFDRKIVDEFAEELSNWKPKEDTLVHQDIRADNFGYNSDTKKGKLIDWNWLCIGDDLLDITSVFINIYRSGLNPYENYPDFYSRNSLLYFISYWFAAISDVGLNEEIPRLRAYQAQSAFSALQMLQLRPIDR